MFRLYCVQLYLNTDYNPNYNTSDCKTSSVQLSTCFYQSSFNTLSTPYQTISVTNTHRWQKLSQSNIRIILTVSLSDICMRLGHNMNIKPSNHIQILSFINYKHCTSIIIIKTHQP